ncbi:unnamed protein product [Rotaria sordida]|uniref:ADP ribosyltransferase domain-containing protein n=1 Tax=Rotaria sordida TaxID=392033 RepID=A0A815G8Z0_9BILA|nr:unnamed protein product [Rotaria sordida]CAF3961192.1 unnamed protein product [Rotaria sordida]
MLNRALRAQDIDILYKFRFFIKDLHEQIQQLHMRHVESMETNVLTVYRGTRMTIDELDQFKKTIGCFLSIYHFLSTSSEQKIALGFALQHLHHPNIEAVILEIKINVQECKTPFANIENFSEYDMEKEILFSLGTIYRLESIEKLTNALEIQEIILPSIHPDIADTYEEMAVTMFKQGENYKNAFIYLRKSIEISLKSLPDNHQLISQRREGLELIREML